jgi:hypothetical protein
LCYYVHTKRVALHVLFLSYVQVYNEDDTERPDLAGPVKSTPAHIGYEIQILGDDSDPYPSGSIYGLVPATRGIYRPGDWNSLDIESRDNGIRVRLNGVVVAESPGDPRRPKTGPIGLQLHDQFSVAMFRNLRIRERSRPVNTP